ncbi:MAG: class I SAM-dependent methyltransferase [Acidobacteriota bacterium]
MSGLEFGSGRSTSWLAHHLGQLTSVEHVAAWFDKVREDLHREKVGNVDYRLIPLDHTESEPEQENYQPLPAYVRVLEDFADDELDFVIVDGHYRTTCIKFGLRKLKPGGLLLVDDTNLWPSRSLIPVPSDWALMDESTNGIKQACIWKKPRSAS